MAIPATGHRPWAHTQLPARVLLMGLALALVVGGGYVMSVGNPLSRGQAPPTYQTAAVSPGTLTLTVSVTGPVTNPQSVPLSFKSSGTLTEVDVSVGQGVQAGQVVARQDTADLEQAPSQLDPIDALRYE
jgi:multidrug efflux pump subunit AcrA (membrane-fusion protein)